MKNEKYIIAVDLDGTLLYEFDKYDKESLEYLKSISSNHHIVIATGRPFRSSKLYYDLLGLNTPIINYNGSLVQHPNDENFNKFMGVVDKNNIIKVIIDNYDIIHNVFCEVEDDIFLWHDNYNIDDYLHIEGGNLHVGNFNDTLKHNPNGAIIFTHNGTQARLEKYIKETFHDEFRIRFWSSDKYVISEIYSINTSKANGLNKVCEYYNISPEYLIAIGDGHNDIEMIEYAKYGVAMGNCHHELEKIAKYKTTSVKEQGVKKFLVKFFNEKK